MLSISNVSSNIDLYFKTISIFVALARITSNGNAIVFLR